MSCSIAPSRKVLGSSASGSIIWRNAKRHITPRRSIRFTSASCTANDPVRTTLQLIDYDEKRLHFYLEIRHAGEGWVAATCEQLALHVNSATRKVSPFPDDILANLSVMKAAHARLARPKDLSRVIGIPGRGVAAEPIYAAGTRH